MDMNFIFGFMFIQLLGNPWFGLAALVGGSGYKGAFLLTFVSLVIGLIGFIGLGL